MGCPGVVEGGPARLGHGHERSSIGALLLMAQPLVLNIVSIPATAYIVRTLGPGGYGEWAIGASLVAVTAVMANLGLRTLFIRSIAQNPQQAPAALAEQLGLRALLGAGAGLAALAICWALRYPPLVLACTAIQSLGLVFTSVTGAAGDLLQAFQRFRAYAAASLVSGFVLTAASVLAMWLNTGPVGLAVSYLSGSLVSALLLLLYIRRSLFRPYVRWDVARFVHLLRETRILAAQQLLVAVQSRAEQMLVPKLLGIEAFGYFSAGSMPANRLDMVPDGMVCAFYPAISRTSSEDHEKAADQVTRLMVMSLTLTLPIAILVTFLAPSISRILFPRNAQVCEQVLVITIWSLPLLGISYPLACALQATGRYVAVARLAMWATALSALLTVTLVLTQGLLGASLAALIRPAMLVLFLSPLFVRSFPSVPRRVPLGRIGLCGAAMAGLLWMSSGLEATTLVKVLLGSVLGCIGYGLALLATGVVSTGDISSALRLRVVAPSPHYSPDAGEL
ncbi:MAG TPA: oligosaccharide flippase family protein [Armatimonadota bacterium]